MDVILCVHLLFKSLLNAVIDMLMRYFPDQILLCILVKIDDTVYKINGQAFFNVSTQEQMLKKYHKLFIFLGTP